MAIQYRYFNGHPDSITLGNTIPITFMLEATAGELALYRHTSYNGRVNGSHEWVWTGIFTKPVHEYKRPTLDAIRKYAGEAQREMPEGTPARWTKVDVTK